VADQEINMVACLTEIMAGCKFKWVTNLIIFGYKIF
jgi:hypothetical protein